MFLSSLVLGTLIASDSCPIEVRRVSEYGISIRAEGFNEADYAVDHIVAYVTVNDGLGQQHELTYNVGGLVQPNRGFTFTTPPISSFVANFGSADVSFTCRQVEN